MGLLSTYMQTLSAEGGINGKTLKECFFEDKMLIEAPVAPGKYTFPYKEYIFDPEKINADPTVIERKGICYKEFVRISPAYLDTDWFSENGNALACIFYSEESCKRDFACNFLEEQIDATKHIAKLYPEVSFHLESSYCPGGCGDRTTALNMDIVYHEKTESFEVIDLLEEEQEETLD